MNQPIVGPLLESGAARIELIATQATCAGAPVGGADVEVALGPARRDRAGGLTFDVAIDNRGAAPRRVDSIDVFFLARLPTSGALRFLRHGWQSWSFTGTRELDAAGEPPFPSGPWLRGIYHCVGEPETRWSGWHESETVSIVGPAHGGPACLVGVLESGRAFGIVHLRREQRVNSESQVHIAVELRVEVPLAAGERRPLESLRVALGDEPSLLLERYADAWGRATNGRRGAAYQTGWCSWYHFFHRVGEDDVRRNLEAIAADRDALPVSLIQIDDGYQSAVGDWLQTNEKFPRGLAPLAAEIRAAGFTAGIWTAPFAAAAESTLLRNHPDWALRDRREANGWLRGMYNPAWSADGWVYALDPSRDDVVNHLERLYAALAEIGFAYQKLDFLYMAALEGRADDDRLTRAQRLQRGLQAIRRGAGANSFLLGCGCPLGPAVGVVDAMRIGPDVAPSWGIDPATSIPGLEAVLPSTRSAIRSVLNRLFLHRRLWLNDPDCLMARAAETHLSAAEIETLAAAIAVGGGMMVFSDDAATLDAPARRLIRNVIGLGRSVDSATQRRLVDPLANDEELRVVAIERSGETILAAINAGEQSTAPRLDIGNAVRLDRLAANTGASSQPQQLAAHQSALWKLARQRPHASS